MGLRIGWIARRRQWIASALGRSSTSSCDPRRRLRAERDPDAALQACERRRAAPSRHPLPWRISVGAASSCARAIQSRSRRGMLPGRPTARASNGDVSHGRARSPAAAGSPARAQFALIVATQSRTGDSRTSPAISRRYAVVQRVGVRPVRPSTSRRERPDARRDRWRTGSQRPRRRLQWRRGLTGQLPRRGPSPSFL